MRYVQTQSTSAAINRSLHLHIPASNYTPVSDKPGLCSRHRKSTVTYNSISIKSNQIKFIKAEGPRWSLTLPHNASTVETTQIQS